MTEREALKLALEALENVYGKGKRCKAAITAIKQALAQPEQHQDWCASLTQMLASMPPKQAPCNCKPAQPEQEPVAWETFALKFANGKGLSYEKPKNLPKHLGCRPLYPNPPEKSQVEETLRYEIDALETKLAECRAQQQESVAKRLMDCNDCGGTGVDGDVDDRGLTIDVECRSCAGSGKSRYFGSCTNGGRCLQGCLNTEGCYWEKRVAKVQPEQEPSELDVWKSRALQAEAVIEKFMAQPEQEPVVWMYQNKSTHEVRFQKHMRSFVDHGAWYEVPLYSEPLANQEKTSGSPKPAKTEALRLADAMEYDLDWCDEAAAELRRMHDLLGKANALCRIRAEEIERLKAQPEPVIDKSAAIRIATSLGWEPKRKPLTDEQIKDALVSVDAETKRLPSGFRDFARAIEAAHGIKE